MCRTHPAARVFKRIAMTRPKPDLTSVVKLARKGFSAQVKWRRHLHQYPELSDQEFETTSFLKQELKQLGLKIRPLRLPTGVVAELRGSRPGPTIAVRSDIDALPVTERTGLPFASQIPGRMHACGHDVHMATVLGTAAILSQLRHELSGTVRFLFQPAEETPPGGAIALIEHGALKGVSAIFGLHVDPHLPVGMVGLCDGPMMASVCDFDITVHGRGSHAARPHLSVDAIVVASAVIEALQKIVSRSTDPQVPVVLTVGKISGGTARNVIADRVELTCTVRTLAPDLARKLPTLIRRTVSGVCRAYSGKGETKIVASYPMLVNDNSINDLYRDVFGAMFGPRKVRSAERSLGGEDFARYLQKVPGAMCRLGVRNARIGATEPWHSSKFVADENAMFYGSALLTGVVLRYAESHTR
jgi:amidohydrolase